MHVAAAVCRLTALDSARDAAGRTGEFVDHVLGADGLKLCAFSTDDQWRQLNSVPARAENGQR